MVFVKDISKHIRCPICGSLFYGRRNYRGLSSTGYNKPFQTCSMKCRRLYEQKFHPRKGIKRINDKRTITYIEKACLFCGNKIIFQTKGIKNNERKKFCSKKCLYNSISNLTREKAKNWKGGKPNCIDCGKQTSYYGCVRCMNCSVQYKVGEYHPSWQGGITPIHQAIRNSVKYQKWRTTVFERDNYTCQMCGDRGGDLNVDHYPITFSQILRKNNIHSLEEAISCNEFWDVVNNRTLCVPCHKTTF